MLMVVIFRWVLSNLLKLLEEEEVEVPVPKQQPKVATKMESDEVPSDVAPLSANEADVNTQDAKGTADVVGAENGVPESGDKPMQMETDTKFACKRMLLRER